MLEIIVVLLFVIAFNGLDESTKTGCAVVFFVVCFLAIIGSCGQQN